MDYFVRMILKSVFLFCFVCVFLFCFFLLNCNGCHIRGRSKIRADGKNVEESENVVMLLKKMLRAHFQIFIFCNHCKQKLLRMHQWENVGFVAKVWVLHVVEPGCVSVIDEQTPRDILKWDPTSNPNKMYQIWPKIRGKRKGDHYETLWDTMEIWNKGVTGFSDFLTFISWMWKNNSWMKVLGNKFIQNNLF